MPRAGSGTLGEGVFPRRFFCSAEDPLPPPTSNAGRLFSKGDGGVENVATHVGGSKYVEVAFLLGDIGGLTREFYTM